MTDRFASYLCAQCGTAPGIDCVNSPCPNADERAAMHEIARLRSQLEWHDIASAPKDSQLIDLAFGGGRMANCYWGLPHHECGERGQYCDSCPTAEEWCDELGGLAYMGQPTHWRAPPDAPPGHPEIIADLLVRLRQPGFSMDAISDSERIAFTRLAICQGRIEQHGPEHCIGLNGSCDQCKVEGEGLDAFLEACTDRSGETAA